MSQIFRPVVFQASVYWGIHKMQAEYEEDL